MIQKSSLFDSSVLVETASQLTPLERQLLQNLADRGPGLLMELAVRVLKFPEEISQAVAALRERGLLKADSFAGGQLGGELLSLTERGRQIVRLLREAAAKPEVNHALERVASAPAPDPRQQEVDLLRKLGDLAVQNGNALKAQEFYEEALQVTRQLSAPPANSAL